MSCSIAMFVAKTCWAFPDFRLIKWIAAFTNDSGMFPVITTTHIVATRTRSLTARGSPLILSCLGLFRRVCFGYLIDAWKYGVHKFINRVSSLVSRNNFAYTVG